MKETKQTHLLTDLWNSYPDTIANGYDYAPNSSQSVAKYLTDFLVLGPYYYYTIDILNKRFQTSMRISSKHMA